MDLRRLLLALTAASAASCGTARTTVANPNDLGPVPGAPAISRAFALRGIFTTTLQFSGAATQATEFRVDGSVTIVSSGGDNSTTRVRLSATFPLTNEQLPWAIAPGACGNGAIAVAAVNKFGTIDVGASGHGSVDQDLAIALTPGATYHVEVYRSGQTLATVIACTTLRPANS